MSHIVEFLSNMTTSISVVGNVSKSNGILIFNGEKNSQTPVQQAFLLHQRLNEVNHTDLYTMRVRWKSCGYPQGFRIHPVRIVSNELMITYDRY